MLNRTYYDIVHLVPSRSSILEIQNKMSQLRLKILNYWQDLFKFHPKKINIQIKKKLTVNINLRK